MRRPRQLTFADHRHRSGWGGPRPGAGRKPASARPPVHHVRRPPLARNCPAHVTLRLRSGLPSLRSGRFVREFRRSLGHACERGSFRVIHYSIQANHVHFLVEAAGKEALGRGMKAVASRLARAVQRVFGRAGAALHGRYHLRILRTPREVRHALAYVLLNARKHWRERHGAPPPPVLDRASSGRFFDGWRRPPRAAPAADSERPSGSGAPERPEVAPPRTWLLARGWRRHGLIDPSEVPGVARAR